VDISERKKFEISKKLESLAREFKHWRDKSEEFKPLQKHHTQIRRITYQLEGMHTAILAELKTVSNGENEDILSKARELEMDILEVHRIWEFFRSKLVLRSVDWFNPYLVAADEYAWSCYEAAQAKLKADNVGSILKQPPLVFFNGGSSPYTMPRNRRFEAEQVDDEDITNITAKAVLRALPVPVIGIPWFQVQHLPDALVIGHEVGHDVQEDFRLTPQIESLLDTGMKKVPVDRRPAWKSWLREIFADVYGNLAGGPAFVESLMDFLATDRTATETDQRQADAWGDYPPDYLRVLINLCVLKIQGFKDDRDRLLKELQSTYQKHAMAEFDDDIEDIVVALIKGPYPEFNNKPLNKVIEFTKADQTKALGDCALLLGGAFPTTDNIRVLFAAASLAFRKDPTKYDAKGVHARVLERVPLIQNKGVRGKKKEAAPQNFDDQDKAAGQLLYGALSKEKEK
jgi:hypothetical protein